MREKYESFAAIAVFREMYDQGKDVYDLLASLIKEVVISDQVKSFSLPEITKRVNDTYSFNLNEAIIKTGLKRLKIKRKNGIYAPSDEFLSEKQDGNYSNQEKMNDALLCNLYDYFENKEKRSLESDEKEQIKADFFHYLMSSDDLSGKNAVTINQYIMSVALNPNYCSLIQKIKEGILIYEGICYSGNINELGTWKSKLDIYFEQETLFYIVGYNGNVHQEMYNELLNYISEINHNLRGNKKWIHLWYGQDVKNEIESYFSAAERIIENGEFPDPSRKPMMYILKDATSKSDILQKKIQFYKYLEMKGINLFEYEYYSEENHQYNMVNDTVYNNLCEKYADVSKELIQKYCAKLNQIEILRKGNNNKLDNVGHILLTANGAIRNLSFEKEFYNEREVPKATTLDFLINHFWFKLNKGFGEGTTPKTLDVIARSRMALSYLANEKVEKAYEDIRKQYEEESISREEALALIAELRSYSKTPDEIDEETVGDEFLTLSQYEIDKKVEELRREEIDRIRDKEEIETLKNQIYKLEENYRKNCLQEEKEKKELKEMIRKQQEDKIELDKKMKKLLNEQEAELRKKQKNKQKRKFILKIFLVAFLAIITFVISVYVVRVEESIGGVASIVIALLFGIPQIKDFITGKGSTVIEG